MSDLLGNEFVIHTTPEAMKHIPKGITEYVITSLGDCLRAWGLQVRNESWMDCERHLILEVCDIDMPQMTDALWEADVHFIVTSVDDFNVIAHQYPQRSPGAHTH